MPPHPLTEEQALLQEVQDLKATLTPGELAYAQQLEAVRMSLARVAQRAGLAAHVPGQGSTSFAHLTRACWCEPRGWNALAARLVDWVDEAREERAELADTRRAVGELAKELDGLGLFR